MARVSEIKKKSNKPFLSICLITYNHEKFIRQAIKGFLMQEVNFDVEIVVHDDASKDQTQAILNEYKKAYPHLFKVLLQTENQRSKFGGGVQPRFNYPRAQGKYIALCDGDDYWVDPLKLQKQVDFLEANSDYIMCFTNVNHVDEHGSLLKKQKLNYQKDTFLHLDMPILAPTLTRVFRNRYLAELDVNNISGGDNYLLTYQSKFGKVKFLNQVTAHYRVHLDGVYSRLNKNEKKMHLIDTRLLCLSIAEYELKLKLFKVIFEYCFQFLVKNEIEILKVAILKIYSSFKKQSKYLKPLDKIKILRVLILFRVYIFKNSYSLRKKIEAAIVDI